MKIKGIKMYFTFRESCTYCLDFLTSLGSAPIHAVDAES